MEDYIKNIVAEQKLHNSKYNQGVSDLEMLSECFRSITGLGIDGEINLPDALSSFCDHIKNNYPDTNILDVLNYAPNRMSFDLYSDDEPDTMIALMICSINYTWDNEYESYGKRGVFRILKKEQCHNIYQGIYFLIVKMGCVIEQEYTRYINRILRMQYRYDMKPYFKEEGNKRFPKYIYDYFNSLLFLFKHGTNIETIQKNAILNYFEKKRSKH
jgi:hypothetical protein